MYLTNQLFTENEARLFREYLKSEKSNYVRESLSIIEECFKLTKYRLNEVCLSFNGGKDCTVVLYLLRCFVFQNMDLFKVANNNDQLTINTLYIKPSDEFEEVNRFIQYSSKYFNLNLIKYDSDNIKQSLAQFKLSELGKEVKVIFMGQRASDPNRNLRKSIQETDSDWPKFVLSNPLFSWSYKQVWSFILDNNVPYCSLYNNGYSSLGTKKDTLPNLKLMIKRENGNLDYLPAYKLDDESSERLNRKKNERSS